MVDLCMNYPYSIRFVKADFSYVRRHSGGFFSRIVDNFRALWIAPGKCRTNPENVGLNPENVGIERPAKTAESRTSTAFAACPRARARGNKRNKKQETARENLRGAPEGCPRQAGSPSRYRVPACGDAKCPKTIDTRPPVRLEPLPTSRTQPPKNSLQKRS